MDTKANPTVAPKTHRLLPRQSFIVCSHPFMDLMGTHAQSFDMPRSTHSCLETDPRMHTLCLYSLKIGCVCIYIYTFDPLILITCTNYLWNCSSKKDERQAVDRYGCSPFFNNVDYLSSLSKHR